MARNLRLINLLPRFENPINQLSKILTRSPVIHDTHTLGDKPIRFVV